MQYRYNDGAAEIIYCAVLIQLAVSLHTPAKAVNVESALWIARMYEMHADARNRCEFTMRVLTARTDVI